MRVFTPRWTLYPRCSLGVAQDFARAYLNTGSIFESGREIGLPFEEARLLLGSLATTALATHAALLQYSETSQHLRVHSLRGFRSRRTSEPIADADREGEWAVHAISTPSGLIVSIALTREASPDPKWVVGQRPWPRRQVACMSPDDSDAPGQRALEHEAYSEWLSTEWLSDEHLSPASMAGALLLNVLQYNYGGRSRSRKAPGVATGCVPEPLTIEQALALGWTPKALEGYAAARANAAQEVLLRPARATVTASSSTKRPAKGGGKGVESTSPRAWRELAQAWVTAQRARWGIRRPRTTPYGREERIGIARVASAAFAQGVKPTDLANALGVGRDTVDRFVSDWRKGEYAPEFPPPLEVDAGPARSAGEATATSLPWAAPPSVTTPAAGVVMLRHGTTILVSELEQLDQRRAAILVRLDTLVGRVHMRFRHAAAAEPESSAPVQGELWLAAGLPGAPASGDDAGSDRDRDLRFAAERR